MFNFRKFHCPKCAYLKGASKQINERLPSSSVDRVMLSGWGFRSTGVVAALAAVVRLDAAGNDHNYELNRIGSLSVLRSQYLVVKCKWNAHEILPVMLTFWGATSPRVAVFCAAGRTWLVRIGSSLTIVRSVPLPARSNSVERLKGLSMIRKWQLENT